MFSSVFSSITWSLKWLFYVNLSDTFLSVSKSMFCLFFWTTGKAEVHTVIRRPIPGTLQNVSKNDTGVQKAVLTGTYSFNNRSNDAFLFKASSVDDAKKQVQYKKPFCLTAHVYNACVIQSLLCYR